MFLDELSYYSKIVDTHSYEFSGKEIEKEMCNHNFAEMHTHTIHWLLIPHICLKSYIYELAQLRRLKYLDRETRV